MAVDTAGRALARARAVPEARAKTDAAAGRRRIRVSDRLADVEAAWRTLEAQGIDSAGQGVDFVRMWTETFEIPADEQVFVSVEQGGRPIAVMGLRRRRRYGADVLMPFGGTHVGCNGPLIDHKAFGLMPAEERAALWGEVLGQLPGDLVMLPSWLERNREIFALSGVSVASDTLFRTQFDSWEACDAEQRSRSRRKHDKQQGAKLAQMGEVGFFELRTGEDAHVELDAMFADRAARFAEQGIADPFAKPEVRAFYRSLFDGGETLTGLMHVLRLDGKVVATRYNLVSGDTMFCLISSMSMDPALSPGSPGKQILVHLMQRIFAQGIRRFDMGAGYTDEKRHWCNVHEPLVSLYLPRTFKGRVLMSLLAGGVRAKAAIKSNAKAFGWLKAMRARLAGGGTAAAKRSKTSAEAAD